jgi:hypothetical protein
MRVAETLDVYKKNPNAYDCLTIFVDCSPSSNLDFSIIDEVALLNIPFWVECFFDIETETFSFFNEFEWAIRKRALEVLLEKITPLPEEKISHILLYKGTIDFSNHIKRHQQTSQEYDEWKDLLPENNLEEEHLLHLYSSSLLSTFFHSLASIFPDSMKGALVFFLPPSLECGKIVELISQETFSHLEIGINEPTFFIEGICWGRGSGRFNLSSTGELSKYKEDEVKTACVLPFLGRTDYKKFEQLCQNLIKNNTPFKIIEENLMNEKWFGIDILYYDPETISFDGKRMIEGFIAANGIAKPYPLL